MSHCMLMVDENTSLHQFCLRNNYSYCAIHDYIMRNNCSVKEAIERYPNVRGDKGTKAKYYYNGVRLRKFCKDNGYPYGVISANIRLKNLPVEEAVKQYLEKRALKKKHYPWQHVMWKTSDGKPLLQWCRENKLHYGTVLQRVYKGCSVDEAIEIALERKGRKDNNVKYFMNGKSLYRYCKENRLNYNAMRRKLIKELKDAER